MNPNAPSAQESYDVVVVGASFAGLSFASAAATHGLSVLVLERDSPVGGIVRTTGILFSDVFDIMEVPQRFLLNAVRSIRMHVPGQPAIDVGAKAPRFFMADVTGMLQWMAGCAEDHGVVVRTGAPFVDAVRSADGTMQVSYGGAASAEGQRTVATRFIIGADGAHSHVARKLGLQQNTTFLAGAEWIIEGVAVPQDSFELVMNHELAPGYCMWLAPHGDKAALGVAGHERTFKPNASLQAAQAIFGQYFDMSGMHIVQRKGGVIPVGGRLRNVYRDDARGRALLLGDAAGLCGAATGGGIYPALLCGRLAAHAVANEVLNGTQGAVRAYLRDLPQAGRLGHYLRIEDWIRLGLDRIGSDASMSAFYGLFVSPEGHNVLQRTLFETPIISMDSGFFSMVRSLLGRSPTFYSTALRAAWQRVTTRNA